MTLLVADVRRVAACGKRERILSRVISRLNLGLSPSVASRQPGYIYRSRSIHIDIDIDIYTNLRGSPAGLYGGIRAVCIDIDR